MIQFQGTVTRSMLATGSKSEHEAVILAADDGKQWTLRRPGGNAFRDPVLDNLVGKMISGTGDTYNDILFLKTWVEIP